MEHYIIISLRDRYTTSPFTPSTQFELQQLQQIVIPRRSLQNTECNPKYTSSTGCSSLYSNLWLELLVRLSPKVARLNEFALSKCSLPLIVVHEHQLYGRGVNGFWSESHHEWELCTKVKVSLCKYGSNQRKNTSSDPIPLGRLCRIYQIQFSSTRIRRMRYKSLFSFVVCGEDFTIDFSWLWLWYYEVWNLGRW